MRRSHRCLQQFARASSGSGSIETALALILAFPVLFAVFELCIFAYAQALLSDAARVGVRYAIVHGTDSSICSGPSTGCADSSGTKVASAVLNYGSAYFAPLSGANVSVTYPDSSSAPPSRVQVSVSYNYVPLIFKAGISHTMNATSEGRIVY